MRICQKLFLLSLQEYIENGKAKDQETGKDMDPTEYNKITKLFAV